MTQTIRERAVKAAARAMCCPGVCQKGDGKYSICQIHSFMADASQAFDAIIAVLIPEIEASATCGCGRPDCMADNPYHHIADMLRQAAGGGER